jgi:NAD(P)-dependent dehydrogenase (short-subunit alcohol dehydrogenase family)
LAPLLDGRLQHRIHGAGKPPQRNDPDSFATVLTNIPLHRMGDPERDIGRAVAFLVGSDAEFITGTSLPVDGGGLYLR